MSASEILLMTIKRIISPEDVADNRFARAISRRKLILSRNIVFNNNAKPGS